MKKLDVGIPDTSFMVVGRPGQPLELTAAITAAVLVAILAVFFQRTRVGRALRAVADDHEAALSIGIPLKTIWVVVWSVAGLVAIVAGIMWGAKSGVQFSLSLIALKALPVLILGGFTSVPGAIVGGLIIGIGREARRGVLGAAGRRGHRELVRLRAGAGLPRCSGPQGLFGEKIIERVSRDLPGSRAVQEHVRQRPGGVPDRPGPGRSPTLAAAAAVIAVPLVASEYWLQAVLIPFLIYALAALGLNLLTGYAGQVSLGTGGFMAVGAYAAFKITTAFPGLNIVVAFLLAGLAAALVGLLFGIPSLRIKGFYLAVATLAAQFFLIWLFNKVAWFTNYASSGTITAPPRRCSGSW